MPRFPSMILLCSAIVLAVAYVKDPSAVADSVSLLTERATVAVSKIIDNPALHRFFSDAGNASQKVAEKDVVNVYSARKEELVQDLFDLFTKQTGIKVNYITDEAGKLLARIEGERADTPMDVFWTADFLSLYLANKEGLLAELPQEIQALTPADMHGKNWTAVASRARVIVYDKSRVSAAELAILQNYEDLALPVWQGRLVTRSSASAYNQFLIASMIYHDNKESTAMWCQGVAENFARSPQGGDTDQLRAVIAGTADIALVNHYYYARLLHSADPTEQSAAEAMGVVYPNQDNRGTHVNISGVAIAKHSPHPDAARAFVKFLLSDAAQLFFANKNYEYPVGNVDLPDFLKAHFGHKFDHSPMEEIAMHYSESEIISVKAGWR